MKLINQTQWWILPILGVYLFAGCRTYGGNTEDLMIASFDAVSLQLSAEASALDIESNLLAEASERHAQLTPYATRLSALASDYLEMVEKQDKLIKEAVGVQDNILTNWVGKDRYRGLHRALGAIVSERESKQKKRTLLLIDLGKELGIADHRRAVEDGRLQIRPHHYNRSSQVLDLRDLLNALGN